MVYRSSSSLDTKKFAEAIARHIAHSTRPLARRNGALVFALEGELGSGKTTFVQGFLRGLGIRKRAVSPTFIIFRRFAVRYSPFASIYHVDAYRIRAPRELSNLGIEEIFNDPQNIVLIEWADRAKKVLPRDTRWVRFSHGARENERIIRLS